jgi:hypothetical protein
MPNQFRTDREIFLEALKYNSNILQYASDEIKLELNIN